MKKNIQIIIIILLSTLSIGCISIFDYTELDLSMESPYFKIENISSGQSISYDTTAHTETNLSIYMGDTIILSTTIPINGDEDKYENIVEFIFLDKEIILNKPPYEYTCTIPQLNCGKYPALCKQYRKYTDENIQYIKIYPAEATLLLNYIINN